jgi:hypothetical protein
MNEEHLEHSCTFCLSTPARTFCLAMHATKEFPDATLSPSDQSERERKREGEREKEGGRERKREGEREKEGGREKKGERERERKMRERKNVEYGYFIFIFKGNDGCLDTL